MKLELTLSCLSLSYFCSDLNLDYIYLCDFLLSPFCQLSFHKTGNGNVPLSLGFQYHVNDNAQHNLQYKECICYIFNRLDFRALRPDVNRSICSYLDMAVYISDEIYRYFHMKKNLYKGVSIVSSK